MSELNPCPNCGSEPDIVSAYSMSFMYCTACDYDLLVKSESAIGAMNAWNAATSGEHVAQTEKKLRDEFAMAALTGILSDRDSALRIGKAGMDNLVCPAKLTATGAYAIADAMLKEREK